MTKYKNDSPYFRDWSIKKLKEEARGYHDTVHVTQCYGTRDVMALDGILSELEKRGVEVGTSLTFND